MAKSRNRYASPVIVLLALLLALLPLATLDGSTRTLTRISPTPVPTRTMEPVREAGTATRTMEPITREQAREATISTSQAQTLRRQISRRTPVLVTPLPRPRPRATAEPRPQPTVAPTDEPVVEVEDAERSPQLRPGVAEYIATSQVQEQQLALVLASNPEIQGALEDTASTIVTMPGVIRQLDSDNREMFLKPYVLLARPLVFDPEAETFNGSILVGVGEIDTTGETRQLTKPITFQVYGSGRAEPNPLPVEATTPPHQEIAISVPAAMAGATVRVASLFNPQGVAVTLPLEPYLQVHASSSRIEGLGLGTATIDVSVPGLENPAGRVVSLRSRPAAYLGTTRVELDENGNGSTTVRSAGVGEVAIMASMAGMRTSQADVSFAFPYITMAAAVLGGLVGAMIRVLLAAGKRRKLDRRLLIASLLCGVLVFALYAVGVNVLPVSPTVTVGATLVFAIAGLGAFLGVALLDKGVAAADAG